MVLYQAKDYKDMSRKAANIISAQVIMKPNAVLGLATGSTPVGAYEQLVEWYNKGDIDFSQVTSVNLDEYKGLEQNRTAKLHVQNIMRSSTALAASTCSCLVSEETDTSDLTSRVQLSRV